MRSRKGIEATFEFSSDFAAARMTLSPLGAADIGLDRKGPSDKGIAAALVVSVRIEGRSRDAALVTVRPPAGCYLGSVFEASQPIETNAAG